MNQTVICDQCETEVATELWDDTVALCDLCYESRPPKPTVKVAELKQVLIALANASVSQQEQITDLQGMVKTLLRRIEKNETHIRCVDQALSTDIFLGGLE